MTPRMKRSPIKKMSEKRRTALGKAPIFSTIAPSSKGVRRVNTKRKASNFKRAYHSKARVKFVKSLPCAACGGRGSVNAHMGTGGIGYKAHYTKIVPLCGPWNVYIGCHALYDEHPIKFRALFPRFNAETAAKHTQKLWLENQNG